MAARWLLCVLQSALKVPAVCLVDNNVQLCPLSLSLSAIARIDWVLHNRSLPCQCVCVRVCSACVCACCLPPTHVVT